MAVFLRFTGYFASNLGLIQGVVWICLSIIAILIASDSWIIEFQSTSTYNEKLNRALVALIKENQKSTYDNLVVKPKVFNYWIYGYLAISIVWVVLSLCLLYVFVRTKNDLCKVFSISWSVWTLLISASDIALTALLLKDYTYKLGLAQKSTVKVAVTDDELLALGVAAAIAARGFILWLLNIIVSLLLLFASACNKNKVSKDCDASVSSSESSPHDSMNRVNSIYGRSNSFETIGSYERKLPRLAPIPTIITPSERLEQISRARESYTAPTEPAYVYPKGFKLPRPQYNAPNSANKYTQPGLKNRTHYIYGEKY